MSCSLRFFLSKEKKKPPLQIHAPQPSPHTEMETVDAATLVLRLGISLVLCYGGKLPFLLHFIRINRYFLPDALVF